MEEGWGQRFVDAFEPGGGEPAEKWRALLRDNALLELPLHSRCELVLDAGALTTGFPFSQSPAVLGAGAVLTYAEALRLPWQHRDCEKGKPRGQRAGIEHEFAARGAAATRAGTLSRRSRAPLFRGFAATGLECVDKALSPPSSRRNHPRYEAVGLVGSRRFSSRSAL